MLDRAGQTVRGEPSYVQVAERLGASVDEVATPVMVSQGFRAASLDVLTHDVPGREPQSDRSETRVVIGAVWGDLTLTEREMLRMRFGAELSQREVAQVLHLSQMHVSRLLSRLMIKTRVLIGALDDWPAEPVRAA